MDLGLAGKRAVVTGAGRGIGLAIVRALVTEGMRVVGGARTVTPDLQELAPDSVQIDLSTTDGPDRLIRHGVRTLGGLDLLVNNVGGSPPPPDGFLASDDRFWRQVFDLNLFSAVRASRAAVPSLDGGGAIINIGSVNARIASPRLMAYGAAKAALVNFGRALAEELASHGIRVNTVSPGPVLTRTWTAPERGAELGLTPQAFLARVPSMLGLSVDRLIEPAEVAALVLLLASDRVPQHARLRPSDRRGHGEVHIAAGHARASTKGGWMAAIDALFERYRHYRELRASTPVVRGEDGCWHVYAHADVRRVISEHELFSARVAFGDNLLGETMIRQDPPAHRRLRTLANRAFTQRRLAALGARIRELAAVQLGPGVPAAGAELDVIARLAGPLPVLVIAEILGVEPNRHADLERWSEVFMTRGNDRPDEDAQDEEDARMLQQLRAYVVGTIERRRRQPTDDLVGDLVRAEVDGGRLTGPELVGFCYLLLLAGNETTANLIGNTVICLARHPEVLARLRADRGLLPAVVEEANRYLSPVQILVRISRSDVRLGGTTIPAGETVFAYLGSANRDERQFADPDRFDPTRREPHLGFGHGPHFCLGATVGRMTTAAAIEVLLDRLPGTWRIVDRPLDQVPAFFLCGVTSLPLISA